MTTHQIIYAWGASPDSVTGQWSANTFYDESAAPYVPLAALAAAYEAAAIEADLTADNGLGDEIRSLPSSYAQAALDRMLRRAKNEALEEAALACDMFAEIHLSATTEDYDDGHSDGAAKCATAIRAMKEKEE